MIEIRYPERIENSKNIIYAIGSEHCPMQFLASIDKYLLKSNELESMPFRLIIPKTDQFHVNELLSCIEQIIKNYPVESVIINDWTYIDRLNEIGINIVLGRQLIGTFNYRDTYQYFISEHESDKIINNTLAPSIIHKSKLDFLSQFSITAIELSPLINEDLYISQLKSTNFKLHMHNNFVSAISKNCTALTKTTENCNQSCFNASKLELCYDKNYIDFSSNAKSNFPEYYLCGNCVYRANQTIKYNPNYYDCIIVDCRMFERGQYKNTDNLTY